MMNVTALAVAKFDRMHMRGFTLIELMIVIAIVGVLSAVAYPSYTESVKRSERSAARAALLETQQFMERFYAANSRYSKPKVSPVTDDVTPPDLPVRLQAVPSESPKYDLTVSAAAVNSYTLTATPRRTDKCGNLTLTNTGVKGRSETGPSIQECWK
jgi:type IV pilus assembly protein PilE